MQPPRQRRDPVPAPRGRVAALALLLAACGCRLAKPDTRYDLLEAEVRSQQRQLGEARAELAKLGIQYRPNTPLGFDCPVDLPRRASTGGAVPLRDITIGNGTGGVDEDNLPGDERFQVVIAPRDEDGTTVKITADAAVRIYEVSATGVKTAIGQWDISPDQLRRSWKSGLLSSGYFVPLQWETPPRTTRVRVLVRVRVLDGDEYEADKEVSVKPMAAVLAQPAPNVLPGPPPLGATPENELPPPARLRYRPDR